jgi:hypothetical protein
MSLRTRDEAPNNQQQQQQPASTAPLELIHELKALQASETRFSQFDERRVRATIGAINDAHAELQALSANPHINLTRPYFAAGAHVVDAAAKRNRRCLATYLSWRLQSLAALWWEAQDDRVAGLCTTAEREFLSNYNSQMVDYLNSFEVPVDARAFFSRPPSVPPSNLVEIRGLRTTSFVSTSSGEIVNLYPGKVLSLPFDEAESLLQRGVAELVRG